MSKCSEFRWSDSISKHLKSRFNNILRKFILRKKVTVRKDKNVQNQNQYVQNQNENVQNQNQDVPDQNQDPEPEVR